MPPIKKRTNNPWLDHVNRFRSSSKGKTMTYKECLTAARHSYRASSSCRLPKDKVLQECEFTAVKKPTKEGIFSQKKFRTFLAQQIRGEGSNLLLVSWWEAEKDINSPCLNTKYIHEDWKQPFLNQVFGRTCSRGGSYRLTDDSTLHLSNINGISRRLNGEDVALK